MTYGKKNGYRTYTDADGNVRFTHRRVAEKKVGGRLRRGVHVHHVNGNKTDNRPNNLVVLEPAIHARVHAVERRGQRACFRCGRTSHVASECYARTDYRGRRLKRKTAKRKTSRRR